MGYKPDIQLKLSFEPDILNVIRLMGIRVIFDIFMNHFISHISTGRTKKSPRPELSAPIAVFQNRLEFHLNRKFPWNEIQLFHGKSQCDSNFD